LNRIGVEKTVMQTATVKWVGDEKFMGISPSGHAVVMDGNSAESTAATPMEMVLMALGACTAVDVVSILKKKRQKLVSLEIICNAEKAPEPPRVFVKIELVYRLRGELEENAVVQAIKLSEEKYCSVSAMLRKTATITWRHEILPAE
jgi:putative redox protein